MSDKENPNDEPEGNAQPPKDAADEFPEYEDRDPSELAELEQTFKAPIRTQYVAKPAPGYDVHGLWHTFDAHNRTGYAAHAVALHWMLNESLHIPTQLIAHPYQDVDIEEFPDDRYEFLFRWHKEAVGYPHAVIASYPPEVAAPLGSAEDAHYAVGPNLIPYCAFEAFPISDSIVEACNHPRLFREIWTVSQFARSCFVESGVDADRVCVIPPPVCDGPWTMHPLDEVARAHDRPVTAQDPFVFGALGSWHKRKGMDDLIRAYFNEFERQEPVQLWIRTSWFGHGEKTIREMKAALTEEIRAIAAECGHHGFPEAKTTPRLRLSIGTDATDQEVIEWIAGIDAYANSSYGEGLGIPHVWAKAHGVPLITSDYGAVGDLVEEFAAEHDEVFDHELTLVDPEIFTAGVMFSKDSKWGGYRVQDLQSAMRRSYERERTIDVNTGQSVRDAFSMRMCEKPLVNALWGVVGLEQGKKWNLGGST